MRGRDIDAMYRRLERERDAADARVAQAAHSALIESITSLHRRCGDTVDWYAIAAAEPPPEPDNQAGPDAVEEWRDALSAYEEAAGIAAKIKDGDVSGVVDAIQATLCLNELLALVGDDYTTVRINTRRVELDIDVQPDKVVPQDDIVATSRGLSRKPMPKYRRAEILADFVCGAALRGAREIMAVTPTPAVLVHVATIGTDAKGHEEKRTILSVVCRRDELHGVNWATVDASTLVATLTHRMKLDRRSGFQSVDRLSVE